MIADDGFVIPFFAALMTFAVVLIVLNERADRREQEASEVHEAAERARLGMPDGHPELLTRALAPADEMWLAALDEELDPEAAE